jgi:hypothetical protein
VHPREQGWGPRAVVSKIFYAIFLEFRHRCTILQEAGLVPPHYGKWLRLLSQDYTGDITIVPVPGHFSDFMQILSNPSKTRIESCILEGERATWPALALMKTRCTVELTLSECLDKIRRRITEEKEGKNNSGTSGTSGAAAILSRNESYSHSPVRLIYSDRL